MICTRSHSMGYNMVSSWSGEQRLAIYHSKVDMCSLQKPLNWSRVWLVKCQLFHTRYIDKVISNNFFTNPTITKNQKQALSYFELGNIQAMLESNSYFGRELEKPTHKKHAPSATHHMRIHGYMFYSNANNNTFMH